MKAIAKKDFAAAMEICKSLVKKKHAPAWALCEHLAIVLASQAEEGEQPQQPNCHGVEETRDAEHIRGDHSEDWWLLSLAFDGSHDNARL